MLSPVGAAVVVVDVIEEAVDVMEEAVDVMEEEDTGVRLARVVSFNAAAVTR